LKITAKDGKLREEDDEVWVVGRGEVFSQIGCKIEITPKLN